MVTPVSIAAHTANHLSKTDKLHINRLQKAVVLCQMAAFFCFVNPAAHLDTPRSTSTLQKLFFEKNLSVLLVSVKCTNFTTLKYEALFGEAFNIKVTVFYDAGT